MKKIKITKVSCSICGDKHYSNKMNGIYRQSGQKYYCHKPNCQKAFIEEAGDPPIED